MNCFQKLLSSWRGTTKPQFLEWFDWLWIAFKNYYLRDEEQHKKLKWKLFLSCELLSKIIIFVTRNNFEIEKAKVPPVVNCFQKLLSSWRGTTSRIIFCLPRKLWIAFKNYYLRDEEQRFKVGEKQYFSCELLSKIIIFVTRNNDDIRLGIKKSVVNCFQKLLSSWRGTTWN